MVVAATIEVPEQMSSQMQEALEAFNAAGSRIEAFYSRLTGEVQRLTGELEQSNLELRRNLAEKEKMQAILVSTLQSLTVGVIAVGQDGIVIVANPAACRMLGRPLEKLATQRIDTVLAEVPGAGELLLTLQGAGARQSRLDWTARDGRGDGRHLELAALRALPPYDLHLAGVILAEDQTELRRLEYQAQLKSRLTGMGEIAMNLAHEIRNPLGSIALFASALARELKEDESLGPLAEQIVNGVKSLEHLVANTLEFARPRRMTMARVNLAEVLADSLTFVEHPLRQKDIMVNILGIQETPSANPESSDRPSGTRGVFSAAHPALKGGAEGESSLRDCKVRNTALQPVQMNHPSKEAWIAGDAEQLRQVFLNLFINAIQAMDEGGTLALELRALAGGGWEVSVIDDGAGIPEAAIEKIFDPFFTTKDKGSGIGLAIVHTILMAHQARIEVVSRQGEGTTFRLTFPAVREFED